MFYVKFYELLKISLYVKNITIIGAKTLIFYFNIFSNIFIFHEGFFKDFFEKNKSQ